MTKQMYLFLLITFCLMHMTRVQAEVNQKPFVIPELKEWKGASGDFIPASSARIVYSQKDKGSRQIAEQLAEDFIRKIACSCCR